MKEDSAKANALVEAARAEIAAKRKIREERFADTVVGWHTDEATVPGEDFPATVVGWDNPAAKTKSLDARLSALLEEERALARAERVKARKVAFAIAAAALLISGVFILVRLL